MFIGESSNKIDDKGRLALPSKYRQDLAGGAVVTKGLDGCLFVYTKADWSKLVERLTTLPVTAGNARALNRHLLGGATDFEVDKQGRFVVPGYLRKAANIAANVVVIGVGDRLEVWDAETWEVYRQRTEADSAEIAEQLVF